MLSNTDVVRYTVRDWTAESSCDWCGDAICIGEDAVMVLEAYLFCSDECAEHCSELELEAERIVIQLLDAKVEGRW